MLRFLFVFEIFSIKIKKIFGNLRKILKSTFYKFDENLNILTFLGDFHLKIALARKNLKI